MTPYELNYKRQLLHSKLAEGADKLFLDCESAIFSKLFLLKSPLLQAIKDHKAPVFIY